MQVKELIAVKDARQLMPGRPSIASVWRWCRYGVRARSGRQIRLEHVRYGRRLYTTANAIEKFAKDLADSDVEHFDRERIKPELPDAVRSAGNRSTEAREKSLGIVRKRLKEAGIL